MNSLPTHRHVVPSRITRFCYFLKGAQDAQRLRTIVLSVYHVNCKQGSKSLLRESALSISHILQSKAKERLPAMREIRVRFLGREDPLEKEMAPHSSTLAWKIPWMEEPGRLQFMGSLNVGHD